jgi:hypothetical protein
MSKPKGITLDADLLSTRNGMCLIFLDKSKRCQYANSNFDLPLSPLQDGGMLYHYS